MIHKESYGFNSFAANRIGEIQNATSVNDWYWVESKLNIADKVTRGCHASELSCGSQWQRGPEFLSCPVNEWPFKQKINVPEFPELRPQFIGQVVKESRTSIGNVISIERFRSLTMLLNTTARILTLVGKLLKRNNPLSSDDFMLADIENARIM